MKHKISDTQGFVSTGEPLTNGVWVDSFAKGEIELTVAGTLSIGLV